MKWIVSVILSIVLAAVLAQPVSVADDTAVAPDCMSEAAEDAGEVLAGAETQLSESMPEDGGQSVYPVTVKPAEEKSGQKQVILMGDSRTVCLYCAMTYSSEEYPAHVFYHIAPDYTGVYEDTIFVGKGGEGFAWFETYGAALGASHIDENSVLVIWFGVNDLYSIDRYIDFTNSAVLQYGVPVYYMTIGPCNLHWESKNPEIIGFNEALKERLNPGVHVIDMHQFISDGLSTGEFATMDGLHYDYDTCRAIYQYMMDLIEAEADDRG